MNSSLRNLKNGLSELNEVLEFGETSEFLSYLSTSLQLVRSTLREDLGDRAKASLRRIEMLLTEASSLAGAGKFPKARAHVRSACHVSIPDR